MDLIMKITWFAIDCNLYTHPKMLNLSAALNTDVDTLVGKLGRLWAWAKLSGNEDGNIGKLPAQEIADIMRWKKSAKTLVSALTDCGFLDASDDGNFLHGWAELNGEMTRKKRKDNERKNQKTSKETPKKFRGNSTENPRKNPGDSTENPGTQYSTVQRQIQKKETSPVGEVKKDAAVAAVMTAYLDKVNPYLSEIGRDELIGFARVMGAEVCMRAIDEALDRKAANWPYIKTILQSKQSQGVRCLADWDALEAKRKKPKQEDKPWSYDPGDVGDRSL